MRTKKGENLQRGLKSREEVVFRSLGGKGTDRKPLMNSEKRTYLYPSKERMLKASLVCPTLCSLLYMWPYQNICSTKSFISE